MVFSRFLSVRMHAKKKLQNFTDANSQKRQLYHLKDKSQSDWPIENNQL
jgi:hypothetical protein